MRKVLIFSKTPYHRTPYDQWLEGSDVSPILLVSAEHAAGYAHLPEVYSFANYDNNQRVQEKAFHLAKTEKIHAVFARAESDILRAAQLRELFHIPGQKTRSALAYRNKVLMKDHLSSSGITLPRYQALQSSYDIFQFLEINGFPVVIKPFSESGSTGTVIVQNQSDLEKFLETGSILNMEIESFVPGPMYHVDGLIRDGIIRFIQPSRYINDCLSYRKDEYSGSVKMDLNNPLAQRLIETVKTVIQHLPSPKHMTFHCELWHGPDDEIIFCEIASRTGGGMINSILHQTSGVNLDKEWLLAECDLPESFTEIKTLPGGDVLIPARRGILKNTPPDAKPPGVLDFEFTGKINQSYQGGIKSGLYLGAFVLTGKDENEVVQRIHETAEWFNRQLEWESANV